MIGIIFIVGLVLILVIGFAKAQEDSARHTAFKEEMVAKYGDPTKVIDDYGMGDDETVYVFEQPQIIVIKGKEYSFDSLLDFSVNGGQSYKISTSTGSALGRGILGGVLFGGVGALAGAGTASKKANPNGTEYLICITTKDLANPMIEYRTKHDTRANELISVLKIILDSQNNSHDGGENARENSISLGTLGFIETPNNDESITPSPVAISIDQQRGNDLKESDISQMCPDYQVHSISSDTDDNKNDIDISDSSSTGKLRIISWITVLCLILGIVIYLAIGYSSSNKPSHSFSTEYKVSHPTPYDYSNNNARTTDRSNDEEYCNSVARQNEMEEMGYEGAANMERNARQEYMRGGGYHAPDGTPQVHFKGSREQAEQLRQMDEMGW